MSTYAIGDIQGCYKEFRKLLKEINFNKKKDTLWLAGDLVNKGPKSYDVIKYIMDLGSNAITVLGNHDFFLMASYYKLDPWPYKKNNFDDILSHKDCDQIVSWLRKQKLIHLDDELGHMIVHAGIYPKWKIKEMLSMAFLIEKELQSEKCKQFIKTLWCNKPDSWNQNLTKQEKLIFATNVFTRMRYLKNDLSLDFSEKLSPKEVSTSLLYPWYEIDSEIYNKYRIIIGHWSTLDFYEKENLISIDTGCVWGNKLTAIKLLSNKKIKRFQVKC